MHESYDDIRSLIPVEPVWFDEHAVPRYCVFTPRSIANIYADEACLLEITCQGCGISFNVALSQDRIGREYVSNPRRGSRGMLKHEIVGKEIHYGDPPNVGCCGAGPTMNSEPRRVLEYWRKDSRREWVRDSEFEVDVTPEWVEEF